MKKTLLIGIILLALICTGCNNSGTEITESTASVDTVSSEVLPSSEPTSSEVSSAVSSEAPPSIPASSVPEATKVATSIPSSSAASSKPPAKENKASSKAAVSSQPPKKTESKPVSSTTPLFGEMMDEAVVDAIIAEGIEYANSKGMTWKDNYTVEGNGYYNPAFSGEGAEIFKRDLFYNIDQLYDLPDDYYVEGDPIYYKIVKGEFDEKGYWYGFVLY